jgi:hypothetical protein
MICGTMLNVHTTYPLCGWVHHKANKCGTKPVEGSSIGAGGGGADLTSPEMQNLAGFITEASQSWGDLLREDASKTRESWMVL